MVRTLTAPSLTVADRARCKAAHNCAGAAATCASARYFATRSTDPISTSLWIHERKSYRLSTRANSLDMAEREVAMVVFGGTGNQGSCVLKHFHAAETPNVSPLPRALTDLA